MKLGTISLAVILGACALPAAAQEAASTTPAPAEAAEPTVPGERTTPAAPTRSVKRKPVRPPSPSQRWVELGYLISYQGEGDDYLRSKTGLRFAGSVPVVRYLNLLGGIERVEYHEGFGGPGFAAEFEQEVTDWRFGPGTYVPLGAGTQLVLNASYESRSVDATLRDLTTPANSFSGGFEADGYGAELGVRTLLGLNAEFAASYKRTELDGEVDDSPQTFQQSIDTLAAQLIVRLSSSAPINLVMRFEHSSTEATSDNAPGEEDRGRGESYLIGLRYRY